MTAPKKESDDAKLSDLQAPKPVQASRVGDVIMTPKLARAGPKIFDKVRAFEERRRSVDLPASINSDDDVKKTRGPNKEEGQIQQKRAAFQHRASSLEDKASYSQRVQGYQNKFAEELQRIKKLVGKSSLKKAFSTEQLCQKDRPTAEKVEPIPQRVIQRLEARERALEEGDAGGRRGDGKAQTLLPAQSRSSEHRRNKSEQENMTQTVDVSSRGSLGKSSVAMETAPVHQLPGQPLPTAIRKSPKRFERE